MCVLLPDGGTFAPKRVYYIEMPPVLHTNVYLSERIISLWLSACEAASPRWWQRTEVIAK